jgi:tol-pal system protein YbgF
MKHRNWLRNLAGLTLMLGLMGCSSAYTYVPTPTGKTASEAAPGAAETTAGQAGAPAPEAKGDLNFRVQALETRVQQLEIRLAEKEAPRPAPAPRRETARQVPAPSTSQYPKPTAAQGDKVYSEGFHLYQNKKYGAAREKFHQYLKEQPQGPKAPEARYHLAYSFYQEGKYKEAAVEFNKLATQFPKSTLAPAALKQQALSYKNLNQTAQYQSTLKKLVQAHPKSPEAKEAQKLLKEGGR